MIYFCNMNIQQVLEFILLMLSRVKLFQCVGGTKINQSGAVLKDNVWETNNAHSSILGECKK